MGFRNISITKDLVAQYGKTKGCAGCKYAAGEQSWFQGHNQHCRKRFLELSEEPGNAELKAKIDRALEKATRRYLDGEGAASGPSKKTRIDAGHPGIGSSMPEPPAPPPQPTSSSSVGTKRTASKQEVRTGSKTEPEPKKSRDAMKLEETFVNTPADPPMANRQRKNELESMQLSNLEACEFYSVPRVMPKLVGKYIKKGKSFDISHPDENGELWDFTKANVREKARQYVKTKKPLFIIGSPPCDPFSIMQNLNAGKCDPVAQQQRLIAGRIHLAFCVELYQMQLNEGR